MPSINVFLRYIGANPETDGELAALCMDAAQTWLKNAGVPRMEQNSLYDVAVYELGQHYFDNRGVMADVNPQQLPLGVVSIMHQLRLDDGSESP